MDKLIWVIKTRTSEETQDASPNVKSRSVPFDIYHSGAIIIG